jgi:hypothetical protein
MKTYHHPQATPADTEFSIYQWGGNEMTLQIRDSLGGIGIHVKLSGTAELRALAATLLTTADAIDKDNS